jgi:uncharacterized protein (TIGR02996 family)
MSVYFVYRTTYNTPLEKHVRCFEDDSVLAWARRIWEPIDDADRAFEHAKGLLGGLEVYTFERLFTGIAEEGTPPPKSMKNLAVALEHHLYVNEIRHGQHHLQLFTDDDETEMALYLFDDHYRAAHPGRSDWLLHDHWELPEGESDEPTRPLRNTWALRLSGDGEGALYSINFVALDSGNLSDLGDTMFRIEGLRLDGLCRFLLRHSKEDGLGVGLEGLRTGLVELLAEPAREDAGFLAAIRDDPTDPVLWGVYSDWLVERGRPTAGLDLLERALRRVGPTQGRKNRDPSRDLTRVTPHLAQASKHEGSWPDQEFLWFSPHDSFETWIFFDDRWAAAHPTLANGLVRFDTRWDVL